MHFVLYHRPAVRFILPYILRILLTGCHSCNKCLSYIVEKLSDGEKSDRSKILLLRFNGFAFAFLLIPETLFIKQIANVLMVLMHYCF